MTVETSTRALGAFLGLAYVALGIAETVDHIDDNTVYLWFSMLCGGGVSVLVGVFKVASPSWASIGLVALGALAGGLAAAWTIVAPILSVTLIVLTVLRMRPAAPGTA